ncbi:MAG: magnesium chelatase [Candidatus Melainabacteria bacterium HGW-Melainabacteria-1]|nr:MAG: magnesium chelatase [Candidatus Melainabacteria bacterium HGW-Melainabacteria-1]
MPSTRTPAAAPKRLIESISRSIIGKPEAIELVVTALLAGSHVLLEDTPGTGKTLLAKSLARSFDGSFKRIQFTSDIMPSDITGNSIFNMKSGEFEFIPGPIFSNIILADEINRATPRSQSSLLEVMEENQVTVDGTTYELGRPFFVIATQNPLESYGTFPLPESQLDRFILSFSMGYPNLQEETDILRLHRQNTIQTQTTSLHFQLEPVVNAEEIREAQHQAGSVDLSDEVERLLLQVVQRTRNDERFAFGASTRASVSFLRALQAYAFLQGREYVIPDDIKYLAPFVLGHRVALRQPARRPEKLAIVQDLVAEVLKKH